jgi:GT2 family glycosyltransferase
VNTRLHADASSAAVVIVTYRSERHLPRLLADLDVAGGQFSVLVVDNASDDGTVAVAEAAGATVVQTGSNLGYAGALNVAWRELPASVPVLVLNPDTSLTPDAIGALLNAVRDPGVGVAVPMLREADGTVARSLRREPSIRRALIDALAGRWARLLANGLSETVWDEGSYLRRGDVEWACGAAMLITAECRRLVGDWDDDRFFLYSEETDFFRRVRAAGLRTVFVPESVVTHAGGGSGSTPELVALMALNRVRYFEKYHSPFAAAVFRGVVLVHEGLRSFSTGHRAALRAVADRKRGAGL